MKTLNSNCLVLIVIFELCLTSCLSTPTPDISKCRQGVCIKIQVAEPVRIYEPMTATIAVTVDRDIPRLGVFLYFNNFDTVVEGPAGWESGTTEWSIWNGGASWVVTAKANQQMQFTRKIRSPQREGLFNVYTSVSLPSDSPLATDSVSIIFTNVGGTIYPEGTQIPITPQAARVLPVVPCSTSSPSQATFCTKTIEPSPLPPPTRTPHSTLTPHLANTGISQQLNTSIPDDGNWITFVFPIASSPINSTVESVGAKFLIDHPRPQDLVIEIQDAFKRTTFRAWDRQTPSAVNSYQGHLLVNESTKMFNGQTVNNVWSFRIRDEVFGEEGVLLNFSFYVSYLQSDPIPIIPPFLPPTRALGPLLTVEIPTAPPPTAQPIQTPVTTPTRRPYP